MKRAKNKISPLQGELPFFRLTEVNTSLHRPEQIPTTELRINLASLLSLQPQRVYSDPRLKESLLKLVPKSERLSALRALIRNRVHQAMRSDRIKLARLAVDEKNMERLMSIINGMNEEQLVSFISKAQFLRGGKFDLLVLDLLKLKKKKLT